MGILYYKYMYRASIYYFLWGVSITKSKFFLEINSRATPEKNGRGKLPRPQGQKTNYVFCANWLLYSSL